MSNASDNSKSQTHPMNAADEIIVKSSFGA
jgi:hypothetical protein